MKKKMLGPMLVSLSFAVMLGACSSSNPTTTSNTPSSASTTTDKKEALAPVELTWYLPGNVQNDMASVEKAINDYIQPKINATLKINMVTSGSYPEKMNTLLSSGESFDLLWTSNWNFLFEPNASKGAFVELSELLPKYAPKLQASLPSMVWEDTKLQGKLYGIPNYQIAAKVYGFVAQKRYIDKYKLDVKQVKGLKDLEPFLAQIKQNEPDAIPYGPGEYMHQMHGYDGVNNQTIYKRGDKDFKVVDVVDTPEYMAHHKLLHEWFNKGYIAKDIATADMMQYRKAGKIASSFGVTLKPGGEAEEKNVNGGFEVVYIPLSEPEFTGVQATVTAISRTSKNPERAMMLLELVNTDSTLYNLLSFGIEGKHHEKVGAQTVKLIKDSGYSQQNWRLGNVTNGYLMEGQAENTWDLTKKMNESAIIPEIFGFKFDTTPVKAEYANVTATRKEFAKAIETGTVNPEEYIPKYREALKKSGNDKILAEHQKQLDAWLKTKGKK
jgi:putative aldouronate transport system substrate-binding protein